jgi:RHS repeat-associated protein
MLLNEHATCTKAVQPQWGACRCHQRSEFCPSASFYSRHVSSVIVDRNSWSLSATTTDSGPDAVTSAINRYYDPATDQFLSIDPDVAMTDQPYVFTNDNPVNSEDLLGLIFSGILAIVTGDLSAITNTTAAGYVLDPIAAGDASDPVALTTNPLDGSGAVTGTPFGYTDTAPAAGLGSEGTGGAGDSATYRGSPALDPANQDMTVRAYASKYLKGSTARQIPGEFENMTVREALNSGNTTVRKLLTNLRFLKGS